MSENLSDTNQYLYLVLVKDQLAEIHHTIERDLFKAMKKVPTNLKFAESIELETHVTAINVGDKAQKLVIDELSRLATLIQSIEGTLEYMNRKVTTPAPEVAQ
jgi:hypothetical protein